MLGLEVEVDAVDLSRTQCACDENLRVVAPLDDIEVLAAELAHDAMDTAASDADACAHGVDAVVEALHGNLGAVAGDACNLAYGDDTFCNLRHLSFEQTLQEDGTGAGEDDLRVAGGVVHACHHGAGGLSLAEEVAGNLLVLRQQQFVAFLVQQQHFLVPHLIDLGGDDLAYLFLVFVVECVVLQLQDLGCQGLA